MKKYLILASAALVALASCTLEITPSIQEDLSNENTVLLTFASERPQHEDPAAIVTKTEWSTNKIVWSEHDRIRVGYKKDDSWMSQSAPGTAKFYASNDVTINGSNASVGTFKVPISGSAFTDPAVSGDYQFFAIYPSSAVGTDVTNPSAKNITLPANQTPGSNTFDKAADIMVGQSGVMSISGLPTDPIELSWTRLVAHADLTFSNLAFVGAETVNKITLTFNSEAKVAGSFAVNIPAATAGAGATNVLVLSGSGITSGADSAEAWACVLPVTFTSLDVELKTDKAIYTRSITGTSKTFKKNARNALTINMSTATRTVNVQKVADGNYVIAAKASDTYYAISSNQNASSQRRDRSEITTVGFDPANYTTVSPYMAANTLVWTVTNVAGGVKINVAVDTDSYMSSGSNTLPLNSTGSTFEVTDGTADGTYNLYSTSYIYMNGSNGFGCYSTAQTTKDLYFIPATGTPTITFPVTSKTVSAATTAVVFTYSAVFLSDGPDVAVTSDTGSAVAETDIADGTLTVTLNENTTASDKSVSLRVSATGAANVDLTITQAGVVGDASNGDVLWAEAFGGFAAEDVPTESNAYSTVYGSASVTYSCEDGTTETKIYTQNTAGGTSPELLISKGSGYFTVTGIPTGNATGMTLTFKSNKGCTVSSGTSGVTIGPDLGSYTYSVTLDSAKPTISLTFTNSDASNNTRVDDFRLVAGAPIPGVDVVTSAATATESATGTTATLNGTITLVNGADWGDVSECGFKYKKDGEADWTTTTVSVPVSGTSANISKNVTGLTKDGDYSYYAYAIYSGDVETGDETDFTPTQSVGKTNQVLFHETFGNNTGSARAWNNSYSVKSGVTAVYSGITGYTVSNAKQSKNTMGSTQSGLTQTTSGTDAYIIIGPLAVSSAENMVLTYQWKAASIKETYTTKLYYATSSGGTYTEVSGTGAGATSFVEREYSLPAAAQVSTLYLKIVWNTSNTSAIIDEVNLQGDY